MPIRVAVQAPTLILAHHVIRPIGDFPHMNRASPRSCEASLLSLRKSPPSRGLSDMTGTALVQRLMGGQTAICEVELGEGTTSMARWLKKPWTRVIARDFR